MDPEDLVSSLVPFLVVLGVIAAIGGGVYYFISLRRGESVNISLRGLFRAYLYLLALVSLLITVGGAAQLVNVGFATALGNDFSYHPQWVNDPPPPSRRPPGHRRPPAGAYGGGAGGGPPHRGGAPGQGPGAGL